jgi:catechol 2,3-dioxygenase-like lactoylglutathione lyase family enzyme
MSDGSHKFEMKLEVVPLPVADVDRAKAFYADKLGFNVDHDSWPNDGVRVVQLTPHGSGCSIVIGIGLGEISEMTPGSVKGLHLVVKDVAALRSHLLAKGVQIDAIIEYPRGIKYAHFRDPDGNSWALQEFPDELRG